MENEMETHCPLRGSFALHMPSKATRTAIPWPSRAAHLLQSLTQPLAKPVRSAILSGRAHNAPKSPQISSILFRDIMPTL